LLNVADPGVRKVDDPLQWQALNAQSAGRDDPVLRPPLAGGQRLLFARFDRSDIECLPALARRRLRGGHDPKRCNQYHEGSRDDARERHPCGTRRTTALTAVQQRTDARWQITPIGHRQKRSIPAVQQALRQHHQLGRVSRRLRASKDGVITSAFSFEPELSPRQPYERMEPVTGGHGASHRLGKPVAATHVFEFVNDRPMQIVGRPGLHVQRQDNRRTRDTTGDRTRCRRLQQHVDTTMNAHVVRERVSDRLSVLPGQSRPPERSGLP
jgi:hypothetical protein